MLQWFQGILDDEVWDHKTLPHHMNSILVEALDAFKVSSGIIIRESFKKTEILALNPNNFSTRTQA